LADPKSRLCQLPLLSATEKDQLLSVWNTCKESPNESRYIHEIFEQQAERRGKATAAVFGEEQISYAELNQRANQLAHFLQQLGVGPETLVGVFAERSIESLIGMLAIFKAGGGYLPLDPSYPQQRLSYMLEDADIQFLLTKQELLLDLPLQAAAAEIVCLDTDWQTISQYNDENPVNQTTGDNLAYVIYTSGSTGNPKGVCITQAAIANHLVTMQKEFELHPEDRVLQFASLNFDVSLEQILTPLISGATIILRDPQTWSAT